MNNGREHPLRRSSDTNNESQSKTEEWLFSAVKDAMEMLYSITESHDLPTALSMGKMYATNESDRDKISMLAVYYRKEISGDTSPPPSLKEVYYEISKAV